MFNASRGEVEFTILNTHSDKIFCPRPDKKEDALVDRCAGAASCYQGLNTKKFTGRFRLGPRRVDDVAAWRARSITWNSYSSFPISTSARPRGLTPMSARRARMLCNPASHRKSTHGRRRRSRKIFRISLTAALQIWKGPLDEWFRDRRPRIHSVYPPFGPEEGGSIVTVRGVEVPEPDSGSYHNASITLRHGFLPNELDVMREWGGQVRECCETRCLSEVTCRLPRISCLHNNQVVKCSKAGQRLCQPDCGVCNQAFHQGGLPQRRSNSTAV